MARIARTLALAPDSGPCPRRSGPSMETSVIQLRSSLTTQPSPVSIAGTGPSARRLRCRPGNSYTVTPASGSPFGAGSVSASGRTVTLRGPPGLAGRDDLRGDCGYHGPSTWEAGPRVASPHELFRHARSDAGREVLRAEPVCGGPNPTMEIRRGKVTHLLLVYPWWITSEGTGRVQAGRADLDYRIRGGRK